MGNMHCPEYMAGVINPMQPVKGEIFHQKQKNPVKNRMADRYNPVVEKPG
ncbi:hypothetical protein GCM10027085_05540 [Spirosoma aerophilum]